MVVVLGMLGCSLLMCCRGGRLFFVHALYVRKSLQKDSCEIRSGLLGFFFLCVCFAFFSYWYVLSRPYRGQGRFQAF